MLEGKINEDQMESFLSFIQFKFCFLAMAAAIR